MKTSELRTKTVDELISELISLRKEQFSLGMQKKTGDTPPKTHNFKLLRRKCAQIKTVLNEKTREVHD